MAGPLKLLLDTDMLSAMMRNNPAVVSKARAYLAEHDGFSFSVIARGQVLGVRPGRYPFLA